MLTVLLRRFGPYLVAVLVLAAYVAFGKAIDKAYDRGVADAEQRAQAALVESIARAQEQARGIAMQDAAVDLAGVPERERIRVVYRDREKEIEKYVPPDCDACRLSPAGLGMLNDALSNARNTPPADTGSRSVPSPGLAGQS